MLTLLARGLSNQEIASRADRRRRHGQDPRRARADEARPARPRPGRRVRVRAWHRGARCRPLTPSPTSARRSRRRPPACSRSAPARASWPACSTAAGYDVTAIDPAGEPPVLPVALEDLDAPPRSFDAAVAMVSLHHVMPLGALAAPAVRGPAPRRPARRRRVRRRAPRRARRRVVADTTPAWTRIPPTTWRTCASTCTRSRTSARSSRRGSTSAEPVPCAYLYRWKVDPALRAEEETGIAAGALPATGSRFIAIRR